METPEHGGNKVVSPLFRFLWFLLIFLCSLACFNSKISHILVLHRPWDANYKRRETIQVDFNEGHGF